MDIHTLLVYVMYLVYGPEAAWHLKGACIQKIENMDPLPSSMCRLCVGSILFNSTSFSARHVVC